MIKRIPFTVKDKTEIIETETKAGYLLIEEQRYIDGNYLVFTNEKEMDIIAAIDALKSRIEKLEGA